MYQPICSSWHGALPIIMAEPILRYKFRTVVWEERGGYQAAEGATIPVTVENGGQSESISSTELSVA